MDDIDPISHNVRTSAQRPVGVCLEITQLLHTKMLGGNGSISRNVAQHQLVY